LFYDTLDRITERERRARSEPDWDGDVAKADSNGNGVEPAVNG